MAHNEPRRKEMPPGPSRNSPLLLFEYQCTSGKFIRLANRIEKIDSVVRIEWKLFLLELECSSPRPWYHPVKTFGIVRVIWYILMQSGGSYLQATIPGTLVTLQ